MSSRGEKVHLRMLVAAGAVSAALAVLATLLAVGYARQQELRKVAHQERVRANEAAEQARDAANRSVRARDQAEELAEFIIEDLRDELIQINRSDLLEAAAQKAVTYFESLPPEFITPKSQFKRASVLLTLAEARYTQGDNPGAIAATRRSIDLWKDLTSADPAGESAIRYGRALGELGLYQNQSGDSDGARETFLMMLRHYEKQPPDAKNDGWWDHGKAKAHMGLGEIARLLEKFPEARVEYARSITNISAALSRNSNEVSWVHMLGRAYNNIGLAFMSENNLELAQIPLIQSLEPTRTLMRLEPQNRRWEKDLGTTLSNLGVLHHKRKDYAGADRYLREALAVREKIVTWDPQNARWMRQLAHIWNRLALLQFDKDEAAAALTSGRNALATFRRLLALQPGDARTLRDMDDFARRYRERLEQKKMADAGLKLYDETKAFLETQPVIKTASKAEKEE